MLTYRRKYLMPQTFLIVLGLLAIFLVACSGSEETANPTVDAEATVDEQSKGEAAESDQPGTPESDDQADPTATSRPESTATPTPEPDETPVSDTESIRFYMRGFNSIARGEYIDAERTFTTVIELEPEFARGWDGRGQAFMLQGKYEEAMLDFDRAIQLKPNLATAYANRALTRMVLDDVAGASRDARRAVEIDDESVAGQIVLGRVYSRSGDAVKALEWFDRAVATDPEDGSTWWWRGRFYRDVLGDGNSALSDFNTAIDLAPAQAALYIDRAVLRIEANVGLDRARADLDEAISLAQDPKLPNIIEQAEELLAVVDAREGVVQ